MPRLLVHTFGGGDPTFDQVTLFLCRDVYHCLPSQLERESWLEVSAHLLAIKAENVAREARRK